MSRSRPTNCNFARWAEKSCTGKFVRAAIDGGTTWTADGPAVRTSGRTRGRTPGGFAGYVRMLVAEVEVP